MEWTSFHRSFGQSVLPTKYCAIAPTHVSMMQQTAWHWTTGTRNIVSYYAITFLFKCPPSLLSHFHKLYHRSICTPLQMEEDLQHWRGFLLQHVQEEVRQPNYRSRAGGSPCHVMGCHARTVIWHDLPEGDNCMEHRPELHFHPGRQYQGRVLYFRKY